MTQKISPAKKFKSLLQGKALALAKITLPRKYFSKNTITSNDQPIEENKTS